MAITRRGHTQGSANAATTNSLAYPVAPNNGDVAYYVLTAKGGSGVTETDPAGYTQILRQDDTTRLALIVYRKVCDGTESGSVSPTVTSAATNLSGDLIILAGVDITTPEDAAPVSQANAVGTTVPAPSITTVTANCYLFFAAGMRLTPVPTYTPDGAMTELADGGSSSGTQDSSIHTAEQFLGAAGATGTRTATSTGSQSSPACLVAVRPAGGLVTVTDDLDTQFNVIGPVTDDLDTQWNVLSSVSDDLDTTWNVLFAPSKDLDTQWNVLGPVTDDLITTWNVLAAVTDDLITAWNVISAVTDDLTTSWNVLYATVWSDIAKGNPAWAEIAKGNPAWSDIAKPNTVWSP